MTSEQAASAFDFRLGVESRLESSVPGAAPRALARRGGPSTLGASLNSTIKWRGAMRLAISASPNSRSRPKTLR